MFLFHIIARIAPVNARSQCFQPGALSTAAAAPHPGCCGATAPPACLRPVHRLMRSRTSGGSSSCLGCSRRPEIEED